MPLQETNDTVPVGAQGPPYQDTMASPEAIQDTTEVQEVVLTVAQEPQQEGRVPIVALAEAQGATSLPRVLPRAVVGIADQGQVLPAAADLADLDLVLPEVVVTALLQGLPEVMVEVLAAQEAMAEVLGVQEALAEVQEVDAHQAVVLQVEEAVAEEETNSKIK